MEPYILNIPISAVVLYFLIYSFLGWCMETVYCSVIERRWVARGFLFGPICPIYGVGALIMAASGSLFVGQPVLFYVVATVSMSAWEYFVGWFLEATTKMKYWDYSHHRFNLNGRISLFISLWWGALAYVIVYFVHPAIAGLVLSFLPVYRWAAAGGGLLLVLIDALFTIRKLALTTRLMARLEIITGELMEKAGELREQLEDLPDAKERLEEAGRALRERYDATLSALEKQTRRFRNRYKKYSSKRFGDYLNEARELGNEWKEKARELKEKIQR